MPRRVLNREKPAKISHRVTCDLQLLGDLSQICAEMIRRVSLNPISAMLTWLTAQS